MPRWLTKLKKKKKKKKKKKMPRSHIQWYRTFITRFETCREKMYLRTYTTSEAKDQPVLPRILMSLRWPPASFRALAIHRTSNSDCADAQSDHGIWKADLPTRTCSHVAGSCRPCQAKKAPSNIRKMRRIRTSYTCTKYHPGRYYPVIHSAVFNDSVSEQWRPWSGPSLSA